MSKRQRTSPVTPLLYQTFRWLFLMAFYAATSGSASAGAGIVAWKEQPFHADASAKVFYFENMERTGPVTWFYRGRERMGFEPHQRYEMVSIPGSLAELTSKAGSDQLKADYDRLSRFAAKYPAAKVMLKSRLEQMSMYMKNYDSGTIASSGKWMTVSEYDKQNAKSSAPPPPPAKATFRTETYVVCAAYLLILLLFTLWRKRTPVLLLLILPFVAAFGWFTYEERGIDWMKQTPEKLKQSFSRLGWP